MVVVEAGQRPRVQPQHAPYRDIPLHGGLGENRFHGERQRDDRGGARCACLFGLGGQPQGLRLPLVLGFFIPYPPAVLDQFLEITGNIGSAALQPALGLHQAMTAQPVGFLAATVIAPIVRPGSKGRLHLLEPPTERPFLADRFAKQAPLH